MLDEDVFQDATRAEEWTHLAGDGAAARARSVRLRRTRHAGIAGATAAVAVGAAAIAGVFGPGAAGGSTSPTGPASSAMSPAPAARTMAEVFQQWKSCPDSELTVVNATPQQPTDLQQRWRDACRRDMATLTALLPGYDVSPDAVGYNRSGSGGDMNPSAFNNPAFVIPAGYTPRMGPNLYRIVGKDGVSGGVTIRAYDYDDNMKPISGEEVTLANGLKALVTLGTDLHQKGDKGYEIYILSQGRTFSMVSYGRPDFDFKALVTNPQFADMAAKALAEPES